MIFEVIRDIIFDNLGPKVTGEEVERLTEEIITALKNELTEFLED